MFAAPLRLATTALLLPKPHDPRRILPLLPLLLGLALGLSGCHARPVAPATPLTPARSLTRPFFRRRSGAVLPALPAGPPGLQAPRLSPRRRPPANPRPHARPRSRCRRLLQHSARPLPPGRRTACLAALHLASLPARTPADADCGPRALLLVCQKLGVKTNLETLRKIGRHHRTGHHPGRTSAGGAETGSARPKACRSAGRRSPTPRLPPSPGCNRDHYVALLSPLRQRRQERPRPSTIPTNQARRPSLRSSFSNAAAAFCSSSIAKPGKDPGPFSAAKVRLLRANAL